MQCDLTGAQILRPGGLVPDVVSLSDGVFVETSQNRRIDLSGYWVLPGIIDLHGDGFERHLAPRRGAMRNLGAGLVATEAELAANGITTAVLAQFYSWEGGMRSPEFALAFLSAWSDMAGHFDTDLSVQLRFETHMLDHYTRFYDLVCRFQVPYVVFNDHLPHRSLAAGKKPPRLTGQALKSGRNPQEHLRLLAEMHSRSAEVPAALQGLSRRLQARETLLGSHDDKDATADALARGLGAIVSEFPETEAATEAAAIMQRSVVLGAPNVVRGGSHNGNVSAADMARRKLCCALASDYHYPSLRFAALALAKDIGLTRAWGLISSGPARILGLSDRGALEIGMRGDFVVLDPDSQRVMGTFAKGRPSYLTGAVAARFI
jgi:alpha-D-ribose 1-methylphosphonate 5-triphosphate diphosphatase